MLRNIGSNWVLTLTGIAATYVLTPFVIDTLGPEGYGTWTLITSLTGYISLMALGVPMACVRYLAQHVAEGDRQKINQTIGSCAGLYLVIGAMAVMVGGVLNVLFGIYEIPATFATDAHVAFALMIVQVSASFIGLLPEGILFAHHDFVARNVIRVCGVLLRFGLTLGLLALNGSLVTLAFVQVAWLTFDISASLLLIRRRYPTIRISIADFDRGMVRRILSFSVYVLLLTAGARLAFETDALVIGAFLGVGAIPFYTVANSLVIYLIDFIVAIAAVVSPMATKLNTQGKVAELREVYLKWSKIALSLTLAAVLFLLVFGARFIGWWIDPSFEGPSGEVLQILMLSCLLFLPARGVALPILMGIGKPKAATIGFLAAGLLNLALSIALVKPLGLAGVALGTAIPNALYSLFVLGLACRELRISIVEYAEYVVPRAALGAVPVVLLLLWFKLVVGVQTFSGLMVAGTSMLVVFIVTWTFFVYRRDRYVDLRPHLTRFRVWSRA